MSQFYRLHTLNEERKGEGRGVCLVGMKTKVQPYGVLTA